MIQVGGWKKIIQCRDILREHIVHKVGNGKNISVWFDNWHPSSPFSKFISYRDIYAKNMSLELKVADVMNLGVWKWPVGWEDKFPELIVHPPPVLISDCDDKILWKTNKGKTFQLCVGKVWQDIRAYNTEVVGLKWCGTTNVFQGTLLFFGLLLEIG